ncbi:Msr family ABC-F type ribosomal protection protein [Oceanobacillus kapialis]|uniref:Msr family ABC-F type ribosomal protection protein n=1 Tax=Oceanobacillus kapialis TaxID=481353 RepID=A0ABW5Q4N7_9BACI
MEKLCFELEDVEVTFLDQLILSIPRLAIHQFDRIGIVGKNGTGKSTLIRLLHGQITPSKGSVHIIAEAAYFGQLTAPEPEKADPKQIRSLGLEDKNRSKLSGGEQTRLKLAQLFSEYHEALLVDEPTTHLDTEGKQYFLDELEYYYGALVLVSHDRHVLDQLATKIWEVADGSVTEYTGNYSDYVAQKEMEKIQQQEQFDKYQKEKQRLLKAAEEKKKKADKITQASGSMTKKDTKSLANKMFMTKSRGTSQKAVHRAAKAIEQRIEQMEEVAAPTSEKQLYFHQSEALKLHNKFPIMADDLSLRVGKRELLSKVRFQFPLGETIAITGDNGTGKTTLLQAIVEGKEGIILSPKVEIGFYRQMSYQFEKEETVLAYMKSRSDYQESKIRAVLNAMSFTGNDIKKNVQDLSGGEAIRLVLCQLFLGRYNILILDEPTNFLDVFSIEALEKFIEGYEGTILLVSHDKAFVDRVADRVYKIEKQQLTLLD